MPDSGKIAELYEIRAKALSVAMKSILLASEGKICFSFGVAAELE